MHSIVCMIVKLFASFHHDSTPRVSCVKGWCGWVDPCGFNSPLNHTFGR